MVLFWIDIKVLNLMLPCFQNVINLFFINSEKKNSMLAFLKSDFVQCVLYHNQTL